jgi:hypothetical protein
MSSGRISRNKHLDKAQQIVSKPGKHPRRD